MNFRYFWNGRNSGHELHRLSFEKDEVHGLNSPLQNGTLIHRSAYSQADLFSLFIICYIVPCEISWRYSVGCAISSCISLRRNA